jgi:glycosyltransferase involved in cell wall biosynthesis
MPSANAMPTVSIVVPCYNYGRYLPECVASALSQEGVQVSVLIIDDASTDDSFRVASELAAGDRRVCAERHQANKGHIATYNQGLARATGKYSVLISADDVLAPGSLQRATALMESYPNVGFVYGGNVRFRSGEALPGSRVFPRPPSWEVQTGRQWLTTLCRAGRNVIASPEVVVRTELQQRLGGYREELPHSGDLEMWMRFAAHADVGIFRNVVHGYVRDHDVNMQRTRFASQLSRLVQRQDAFDYAFSHYGHRIDPSGRLQRAAYRSLRADALWWVVHCGYHRDADARATAGLLKLVLGADGAAGGPLARRARRGALLAARLPALLPLLVQGARRARQDRAEPGQPARFVEAIAVRRPLEADSAWS